MSDIISKIENIERILMDLEAFRYGDKVFMTGREWYNRFLAEYHNKADWISADEEMGADAEHDVLLCAKLASGLPE